MHCTLPEKYEKIGNDTIPTTNNYFSKKLENKKYIFFTLCHQEQADRQTDWLLYFLDALLITLKKYCNNVAVI